MKILHFMTLSQLLTLSVLFLVAGSSFAQDNAAASEKSKMLYRRGLAAYKAGDFSSAESFFEQTLEAGYSADAAVYLTYIRKETGDFEGALESLQTYLDHSAENDPELHSYISLKLFLEARIASQKNGKAITLSYIAVALGALALIVSVISLRMK